MLKSKISEKCVRRPDALRLSTSAFLGRGLISLIEYIKMDLEYRIKQKLIQINNLISEYSQDSKYSKRCFVNQIQSYLTEINLLSDILEKKDIHIPED